MKQIFSFYIFCLWQLLGNVMIYFCTVELKRGYSLLQRGHRLEKRLITNLGGISFLDCVEECLRSTRCLSVNYFQPAHFCEVNYKKKESLPHLYLANAGWYYSERNDWDKAIAGPCSNPNCHINEKCVPKAFGDFTCKVSDCGIPMNEGISFENVQDGDAIGVNRKMHITCLEGYERQGSELFVCQRNGVWKADLKCNEIYRSIGCYMYVYNHVLEALSSHLDPNGRSYCAKYCSTRGSFQYFGLMAGDRCFCGNGISEYRSLQLSLDECNETLCYNNPKEMCVGMLRIEVFLI